MYVEFVKDPSRYQIIEQFGFGLGLAKCFESSENATEDHKEAKDQDLVKRLLVGLLPVKGKFYRSCFLRRSSFVYLTVYMDLMA